MDGGTTLALHGDLSASSVRQLQAILDGLMALRPRHLVIDLAEVDSVSLEALRIINRCCEAVGGLVLLSPSAATRATLVQLACSGQIGPRLTWSAST